MCQVPGERTITLLGVSYRCCALASVFKGAALAAIANRLISNRGVDNSIAVLRFLLSHY